MKYYGQNMSKIVPNCYPIFIYLISNLVTVWRPPSAAQLALGGAPSPRQHTRSCTVCLGWFGHALPSEGRFQSGFSKQINNEYDKWLAPKCAHFYPLKKTLKGFLLGIYKKSSTSNFPHLLSQPHSSVHLCDVTADFGQCLRKTTLPTGELNCPGSLK